MKVKFPTIIWSINSVIIFLIITIVLLILVENRFPMIFRGSFKKHDRGLIVGDLSEKAKKLDVDLQHLMYDSPTKIKYSDYYMVDIIALDKDLPPSVKESIALANDFSIHIIGATVNIVFFNEDRTDVHKLLDSYGYIKNVSYPKDSYYSYSRERDTEKRDYILYEMSFEDTNEDGRINDQDSTAFFLSDLRGRNLKQFTPFSIHFDRYSFSEDLNEIYFEIVERHLEKDVLGYYLKSRKLYYYNIKNQEFGKFEELDKILTAVQKDFKL